MGFFTPSPPPFELEEWKAKPHLTRLKPLVQDWGVNGFGSPTFVYFIYVFKLIVFQKLAVWLLLWEILGLGAGSMPLSFRFVPPIGGVLYWLRPGTVRLPPWPDRVPFTRGTRRTWLDVALYAALV